MSSSEPSTKKTRSFRAKTLEPAGVKFIRGNERPDESAEALWTSLRDFKNVFPRNLSLAPTLQDTEGVPSNTFGSNSVLDETTSLELIKLSERVADSADRCSTESYIEASWRSDCHNHALSLVREEGQGKIVVLPEEEWQAITVPPDVILSKTKPDYSIGYRFNRNSPLHSDLLRANTHRGLDPFINEARTLAFPLAVAESKSNLGTSFEADNQCAENAIKMLYKLSKLGGPAANLPVVCMALVGRFFTIYIGTTSFETSSTIYRIHKMWSGDVSVLWPSVQFQFILWKLARWIRTIALNAILQSMHTFVAED